MVGTQTVADATDVSTRDVPFIMDVRLVRGPSGGWVADRGLPGRPGAARPLTALERGVLARV